MAKKLKEKFLSSTSFRDQVLDVLKIQRSLFLQDLTSINLEKTIMISKYSKSNELLGSTENKDQILKQESLKQNQ